MKLYQPRNKAQATLLKKLFIDHEIRFHNNRLSAKEFCAEFDLTLYFLPSTGEGIGGWAGYGTESGTVKRGQVVSLQEYIKDFIKNNT